MNEAQFKLRARQFGHLCIEPGFSLPANKPGIIIEEVDEANYWMEFIIDENLLKKELVEPLFKESAELSSIFIASRKTTQKKMKEDKNKH